MLYGYYSGAYFGRNVASVTANVVATGAGASGTCAVTTNFGYGFGSGSSVLNTGASGTCPAAPGGSANSADRVLYEPTFGDNPDHVEKSELRRPQAHHPILLRVAGALVCRDRPAEYRTHQHGVHRPPLRFAIAWAARTSKEAKNSKAAAGIPALPWSFVFLKWGRLQPVGG